AIFGYPRLPCHLSRRQQDFTEDGGPTGNVQRCDMLTRHHEHVSGSLGVDVSESDTVIVLKHDRSRDFLSDYSAEETRLRHLVQPPEDVYGRRRDLKLPRSPT